MNDFHLDDDDVIAMYSTKNFTNSSLFKFRELKQGLREFLSSVSTEWIEGGAKCEVLRTTGGGWQRGRFRLRLEFIPDPPEEPKS